MAYNLPETVDNLCESIDSLHDNKELQVCTGMALPGTGLRLPDSGKLHRSLSTDEVPGAGNCCSGTVCGRLAG